MWFGGPQALQPLAPNGPHRQRNPVRHLLAETIVAPGPVLEPGMAAARALAGTQVQPGGDPLCTSIKLHTHPVSFGGWKLRGQAYAAPWTCGPYAPPAQRGSARRGFPLSLVMGSDIGVGLPLSSTWWPCWNRGCRGRDCRVRGPGVGAVPPAPGPGPRRCRREPVPWRRGFRRYRYGRVHPPGWRWAGPWPGRKTPTRPAPTGGSGAETSVDSPSLDPPRL